MTAGVKVDSREDGGSVTVETVGSTEKLLTAVVLAGLNLPSGYLTLPVSEFLCFCNSPGCSYRAGLSISV